MVALRHNFDGGPNAAGITVANSAQVPGNDPFNGVGSNTSPSFLQYGGIDLNNLNRGTAEYAMGIATHAGVATGPWVLWSTSFGTQTQCWTRFYLYLTSTAANTTDTIDLNLFGAAGATQGVGIWIPNTVGTIRYLQIQDSAATPAKVTMTTPLVAGQWCRVEFHAVRSTGASELYLYAGADVDTNNYTELITQTGGNYGTSAFTQVWLGQGWDSQGGTLDTFLSNWEVNTTGYPGPAPFRAGKGVPGILTNPVAIHMN